MTEIGDTLYCHDTWRNSSDWSDGKITGETKMSWLVGSLDMPIKINKKTMLEFQGRYTPCRWYTKRDKADYIWISANAQRIGSAVGSSRDVAVLERIAALIGCKVVS